MRKSLSVLFIAAALIVGAQDEKVWRIGVELGSYGNHVKYAGGMEEANARFHQNEFGAGSLSFSGRYDINHSWMLRGSIGFTSFGFDYAIAENYSLLRKDKHFTAIRSEFGVLEIPVMGYYKFKLNCNNARWLVGAGVAQCLTAASNVEKSVSQAADGNTMVNYLHSTSASQGGAFYTLRWAVEREKLFKCGGILNAGIIVNLGLSRLATSSVDYTIDNRQYTHEFHNNGSFVGFRVAYFFRPVHTVETPRATR